MIACVGQGLLLAGITAHDVLQIDAAGGIDDHAGKEIIQGDLVHRNGKWLHAQIDTAHSQRFPAHEIVRAQLIHCRHVFQCHVTFEAAAPCAVVRLVELQCSFRAEAGAGQRQVDLVGDVGLQCHDVYGLQIECEIDMQGRKSEFAAYGQLPCLVDRGLEFNRAWCGCCGRDVLHRKAERRNHGYQGFDQALILQADRPVVDRQLADSDGIDVIGLSGCRNCCVAGLGRSSGIGGAGVCWLGCGGGRDRA